MAGKRWNTCNVFAAGPDAARLWSFEAKGAGFKPGKELTLRETDALPVGTQKTWSALWQPKLNVACLPPERVFIRVAQFPKAEFDETLAMVELQLEKLSPMPVGQIVWTLVCRPHPDGQQQTVVLVIAARDAVEEFLGQLETRGYLADRLELPALDQLLRDETSGDGAWIFPELMGGVETAAVAWWAGGVLRSVDWLSVPPGAERVPALREQLSQMAWAGEVDGWLTGRPDWHLVADDALAAQWLPPLRDALGVLPQVVPPLPPVELAGRVAVRAAAAEARANLLPAEFTTRYRQRFVDRLWMRGVGAVVVLYLIGVAAYFAAVGVAGWQARGVETQVKQLSQSYTNALQLRGRFDVLKDRQELKFAALDCWKVVAEHFPEGATLESFTFRDGQQMVLNGTAPGDAMDRIIDFHDTLKRVKVNGQPLFDPNKGEPPTRRAAPGNVIAWNFSLELRRSELLTPAK
mgnify:CR=1 FL=1